MRKLSLVCLVLLLGAGLVFSQTTTTGSGSAAPPAQQHPDVPPSQPVNQPNQNNQATTPPDSRTGQTAKDVGIGAGIGTVAGLIFGHAVRGLAVGTIAGGGYVLATQGKDVDLPTETGLVVRVDQDTAVPANTGGR